MVGLYFQRIGLVLLLTLALLFPGCHGGAARWQAQNSLMQTQQLYSQNRALEMQRDNAAATANSLSSERATIAQQNEALRRNLEIANQRLDNLQSANSALEQRYKNLMANAREGDNPLSSDAIGRFKDLQKKYPEFEFDPVTGVSKFHSDLLFPIGSDEIRPEAIELLREFAEIMNRPDSRHLNILCVGHTDDRPISRANTRNEHPSNWHLSTDRANSVVLSLRKFGLSETRMGAAGYGPFQPVAANIDEKNRQMNRRVEIFVLAPDAVVAGWDPNARLQ